MRGPRSASVDERARQGLDLARKQQRELKALEQLQAAELAGFQAQQARKVEQLKQQHVRQTVDLWVKQGRTLGPWAAPVLEGRPPAGTNAGGKVGHG